MLTDTNEGELLELLDKRIDLLGVLLDGPRDKRALVDELPSSRSTVDRGVRELEVHGLVTFTGEGYALTTVGELATSEFRQTERYLQNLVRLRPFLDWTDLTEFDLPVETLSDAELVVSDPNYPAMPSSKHVDHLAQTSTFAGLLPSLGRHAADSTAERIQEGSLSCDVVLSRGAAEIFRSKPGFRQWAETALPSDDVEVQVFDDDLPYFLGIYDDVVHIGAEDDNGMRRALVETDDATVRDWAENTFRAYKDSAAPFTLRQ